MSFNILSSMEPTQSQIQAGNKKSEPPAEARLYFCHCTIGSGGRLFNNLQARHSDRGDLHASMLLAMARVAA